MNEKEAREIITKHTIAYQEGHADIFDSHKYGKAEGYLEAMYKAKHILGLLKEVYADPDRMVNESFTDFISEAIDKYEDEI